MKFSIILLLFYQINNYVSSDNQLAPSSKIERFNNGYKYSIKTAHIVRVEEAHFNPHKPEVSVVGAYYFNATDGRTYHVRYEFNKKGYSVKFGTGAIVIDSRIGAPAIKSLVGGGLG